MESAFLRTPGDEQVCSKSGISMDFPVIYMILLTYIESKMNFRNITIALLVSFFLCVGCTSEKGGPDQPLELNGNVDNRQINLVFQISERIAELNVEEGAHVKKGDPLGKLETIRVEQQIAEAQAQVDAASASVTAAQVALEIAEKAIPVAEAAAQAAKAEWEKAENGSRKEDVAIAEATLEMFSVQIPAAKNYYERNKKLAGSSAVSEQETENAEASWKKLVAQEKLAQANLEKLQNGTRVEEKNAAKAQYLQTLASLEQVKTQKSQAEAQIEQSRASLAQAEAVLAIRKQTLADCELFAPCDGIIRSRLLDPGEMASPQLPAFTLAVVSPKWVRVYVEEPLLPRVKMGQKAKIQVDGLKTECDGWVGFISPSAEFTPKNVETKDLRTSLVYEVRVFTDDPEDVLKLGMPVTVRIGAQ